MANASRDGNFVPTLLGVSSVDFTTPVTIAVDPTTHQLQFQQSATQTITPVTIGISATSSGDNTLVAAVTAKKIYVYAWNLSFSGTVNASFTDGLSGTVLNGLLYGVANAGGGNSVAPPAYLWGGSTNTALVLNLSTNIAVGGSVSYFVI